MRLGIDLEPVYRDDVRTGHFIPAAIARVPTQLRFGASNKFERTERLHHVVVRPEREPLNLIGLSVTSGKHNHGIGVIRANRAQKLKPIDIGKHDVENREVEFL